MRDSTLGPGALPRWTGTHGTDGWGGVCMAKSNSYTKYDVSIHTASNFLCFYSKGKGKKKTLITILFSSFTQFIFSFRENRASCMTLDCPLPDNNGENTQR